MHWLYPIVNLNASIIGILSILYFFIPILIVNINCAYYCYRENQCIGLILSSILMRLLLVFWNVFIFWFCWWTSFIRDLNMFFTLRDTLVFIHWHNQLYPFVSRGLMQMFSAPLYGFLCWCFSPMGMQLLTKIWFQIFFFNL